MSQWLLLGRFALVQTVFQTGSILLLAVGLLVAQPLAPAVWGGVPLALAVAGTLVALFPASALMRRWGRKRGLLVGIFLGVLGTVGIVGALHLASFPLLCASYFVFGLHQAFLQYLRFMAMEAAGPHGSRALSAVLLGGIPAALLGPALGFWGRGGDVPFAASFAALLVLLGVQAVIAATLPNTTAAGPSAADDRPARPWGQRLADPALWLAVAASTFSFGLMVLFMAALPVAMHEHGHPMAASTLVLQLHVLGMYVPSFFSGTLVRRWGPRKLIAAGVVLFGVEAAIALSGTEVLPFAVALTLLGVGWNFLFVGGTSLLVTVYRPAERAGVQAFHDTWVYAFATVASLGAGWGERLMGWGGLQFVAAPFLGILIVLFLVNRSQKIR